jgi:hypothetical protein
MLKTGELFVKAHKSGFWVITKRKNMLFLLKYQAKDIFFFIIKHIFQKREFFGATS